MKKNLLLTLLFVVPCLMATAQKTTTLKSPNGKLSVSVTLSDKIYYSISDGEDILLNDCSLSLDLGTEILGQNPKLSGKKETAHSSEIAPVIPLKFAKIENKYNQLRLNFKGNYAVEFRAYDEGVAYRFVTNKKGEIEVMGEEVSVNFPQPYFAHLQETNNFETCYEGYYSHKETSDWKADGDMASLPILLDTKKGSKILIAESNLFDYPCLLFNSTGNNGMKSTFSKYPLELKQRGDRHHDFVKRADYIAKTKGQRDFPWRYFLVAKDDADLITNTMTVKLAPESVIADPSWIKPGQVSWEWWNDASPYGPDVNFVSGYNLDTYKYYIDFASKFGIPYIIMDEGWAKTTQDPYTPNPKVDVHELIRYGKEKNVGIVLWLTWLAVENNLDKIFETFNEWGVKGVKIDFMDRTDQWMVNYYERVAEKAAASKILVDFHGSFVPAGLECKYPNVLSYEGVRGLEQMGGCQPSNTIYQPFMRNSVGPMDFTPGAMINMQPNVYCGNRPNSASVGTRAYQMALFVVMESGLQMLCDNPTMYYRNEECTEFITKVPVTWDETKVLSANVGEAVAIAKRKGDKWYIGAITNDKGREVTIDLGFLADGKSYKMTNFEDGINAGRQAMDYRKKTSQVKKGDNLTIKMARNGGWAAIIE